jgi:multidrug efflux pump subunit AcrB
MNKQIEHNGKIVKWINLTVEPRNTGDFGFAHLTIADDNMNELEDICKEISREIRRIPGVKDVQLNYEYEEDE